jgi:hypothetical protein
MKIRAIVGTVLVLAASVLALGQSKPARTKKTDPDMVKGPLLRMDLLELNEGPFVGPKRDPFVPGAFTQASSETPMSGSRIGFQPSLPSPGLRPGMTTAGDEALSEPVVNVRYVGFIQGKEKLLALVLFNGQAVAVAAGESLGNVWTVARITAVEIEIQGPDGATLKFALEGERK